MMFRILDLSAGNRAVWFNKRYPDAVYVDIRPEVGPDIVADTRDLPDAVGDGFSLVVFDPPHSNYGANGNMAKDYGHFTMAQIRSTILESAREAHRVTRTDALMALKWHTHALKLDTVLEMLLPYWQPLFGHGVSSGQRKRHMTSWVMLRRRTLTAERTA